MDALQYTVEDVIARYIALRDAKEALAERHKAEMAPYHAQMETIEAWLQAKLIEIGADNIKTESGTAYRSTVQATKVVDWDTLLAYILDSGQHDFLVRNVNKTAVLDHIQKYGAPPGGVEVTQIHKVNVRRS